MSCSVGGRSGSDLALLWLWCRTAATAPIRPLTGEPPYATGAALEKAKKKKRKRSGDSLSTGNVIRKRKKNKENSLQGIQQIGHVALKLLRGSLTANIGHGEIRANFL